MSIKAPKPRQIRLPFDVPRPSKSDAKSQAIKPCGICRKRDSRYTCPRCNVLYCSLECFRDESHAQCSEPFYKSTVMSSIASDPSAGLSDKKDMLDMLRRFEEAQAGGAGIGGAEGESEGGGVDDLMEQLRRLEEEEGADEELAEKLKDVDLDNIDSNALFHLLPQTHRDAFLQALRNPDSETTKALLEDAVSRDQDQDQDQDQAGPDVLPWWEAQEAVLAEEDEEDDENTGRIATLETAPLPELIPDEVVEAINPPSGVGKKLVYNAIAICIAYVHTLLSFRLPSLDSLYLATVDKSSTTENNTDTNNGAAVEISKQIGDLVPFLTDPRSTVRYESLGAAWGSVWEIVGAQSDTPPSPSALETLLSILPKLLHPPLIADSRPRLFNLLSDLYHLFSISLSISTLGSAHEQVGPTTTKRSRGVGLANMAVQKKLAFHFRALDALDRRDWLALEKEVDKELEKLREESRDSGADGDADSHTAGINGLGGVSQPLRGRLEVL
ncbi:hypothetical protein IAU59_000137 [Kwoniella sp. CBS 9459]